MQAEIKRWLNSKLLPLDYQSTLVNASSEQLFECFGAKLTFGTGGMRGLMGVGPNRINDFTIKGATIGLAYLLLEKYKHPLSVIIAYDTRQFGRRFAEIAAQTLAHYHIKSFVFKCPRPTPHLSFAVRTKKAQAGIVITASHNPSTYNGYKLYDENGCQFVPSLADRVSYFMDTKEDYFAFELEDYAVLVNKGIISELSAKDDESYLSFLNALHPKVQTHPDFKVVYTPIHGTGYAYGAKVLRDYNFTVFEVEEQRTLDGSFSTVKSPNPESKEAFSLAEALGRKTNAELLLATDPDGDRLGVAVRDQDKYIYLSGSMLGALLLDYLIKVNPPQKGAVMMTTIVTPRLGSIIAEKHGIKVVLTLTGFKFIGDQIELLPRDEYFYFGYEESFGYLFSPMVRDKDAFQALIMTANMFHYYYTRGKDINTIIENIYQEYGYFNDELLNYEFMGIKGATTIKNIMHDIRTHSKHIFSDIEILSIEDYLTGIKYRGKDVELLTLPKSDVYRLIFENGTIAFRPSGTEPKMKIYISIFAKEKADALSKFLLVKKQITTFMEQYHDK